MTAATEESKPPLMAADHLTIRYGNVTAVADVSLDIPDRPVRLGLIGESGSGKTTVLRALLGLIKPADGAVTFRGTGLAALTRPQRAAFRGTVQPVFQDGNEALDPRLRVRAIIAEALPRGLPKDAADHRIDSLLGDVGLSAEYRRRFPHEMSGGQRQRIIIARALAAEPSLLLLDEPTSALDVLVQQRILDLIDRLCRERALSTVLVTHNLAVAQRLCDTACVMLGGRIVESGQMDAVLRSPSAEYTRTLVAAVPRLLGS